MMHQAYDSETRNKELVAVLYQRYASTVLLYLRQHSITREDAEDLLVEVFMAGMENQTLLTLQEDGAQLAWLRRVARNKLIDHLRRTARQPAVTLDELTEVLKEDENFAPEQVVLQREVQAQLRARLAALPEQQQEILRLRFAHGLRSHEIGELMNKSDSAVRMLLSRAMNFLRTVYGQQKGGNIHE